jgi:arylsulfatase A-like enzyme
VFTPVLRVPLVIRLPFPVEPIRVAAQVRNLDIAPTLIELAGLLVPPGFEGHSLVPLLIDAARRGGGDASPTHRISFAALGLPLYRDAQVQESVNDGAWSYARNVDLDPRRSEFLFDPRVHPDEQVNLIEHELQQKARLRLLLEQHRRPPPRDVRARDVRIDPAIAERLRAMGYLE